MADPSSGVVTFLFTDVEGSTRLLEEDPAAADRALLRHHELLAAAVAANAGTVFETVGDAVYAAFGEPRSAVAAAVEAQRAMAGEDWAQLGLSRPMRIRIAVHLGTVERRGHRYFGTPLFASARLLSLAHGGQILISDETRSALDPIGRPEALPAGWSLRPLGRHRLKDLAQPMVVHQVDTPDLEAQHPPLRSLGVVHLPAQPTAFVGRTAEIDLVRTHLRSSARLVTLTGPGGTGKTRLALEAASGLGDAFPDGVYWVPLAAIGEPDLVLPAIGASVGATGDAALHLRTWTALLLLDNVEQVIDAAGAIAALLAACPAVSILATSREPLRVAAERVVPVPPLEAPECVWLLRDRAIRARPGLAIDDGPATAICEALDRLPLAVELAAARLRLFTPEELLQRLPQGLDAVGHGGRDVPARQRTLRATIAWSVDLLADDERDLYERLAVFAGGWTLAAADQVCDADPEMLLNLVDRSLVRRDMDGRFDMLEIIHADASERLAARVDADAVRSRHASHFGGLAADLHRALDWVEPGADVRYYEELDPESDNLWAALDHVTGKAPDDTSHRIVAGTWRFWLYRGRGPGMLERIRPIDWASAPYSGSMDQDARSGQAELEREFGDPAMAIAWKQVEVGYEDPANRAAIHADLADLLSQVGRLDAARVHAHQALELRRSAGDPPLVAHALASVALVEARAGRLAEAVEAGRQIADILAAGGGGDILAAEVGVIATTVRLLGGDLDGARRAFPAVLSSAVRVRLDAMTAHAVELAAAFALADGDERLALTWASVAQEALRAAGRRELDLSVGPATRSKARQALGSAASDSLAAEARLMPLEAVVDDVVAWLDISEPTSR